MAEKKSDKEKRETRRLAKARYRARKAEKGLKQLTIWLPKDLLEKGLQTGIVNGISFGKGESTKAGILLNNDDEWEFEEYD